MLPNHKIKPTTQHSVALLATLLLLPLPALANPAGPDIAGVWDTLPATAANPTYTRWGGGVVTISPGTLTIPTGSTIACDANNGNNSMDGGGLLNVEGTFQLNATTPGGNNITDGTRISLTAGKLLINRIGSSTTSGALGFASGCTLTVDQDSVIEADLPVPTVTQVRLGLSGGLSMDNGLIRVKTGTLRLDGNSDTSVDASGTIDVTNDAAIFIRIGGSQTWGSSSTGLTIHGGGKTTLYTFTVDGASGGFISLETTGDNELGAVIYLNNGAELRIADGCTLRLTPANGHMNWYGGGLIEVKGELHIEPTSPGGFKANDGTDISLIGGLFRFAMPKSLGLNAGSVLTVDATSTIEADLPNTNDVVAIQSSGTIDLKTGGSVVVSRGRLELATDTILVGGSPIDNTLGFNATVNTNCVLDIDHIPSSTITNIGTGATLHMKGSARLMDGGTDLLSNKLATVDGTLQFSEGHALTPNGTLTVKPSGKFGGTGTLNGDLDCAGTFDVGLNDSVPDKITVNGAVTLSGPLQMADALDVLREEYTIIDNDGEDPVVGTFAGISQGKVVPVGTKSFRVSYTGGTGNDVTIRFTPRGTVLRVL